MPKPVYLMTVQEAHKEYNFLMGKIRAKYEQLDSGEFGSPGTPAFDAKACELANLLACVILETTRPQKQVKFLEQYRGREQFLAGRFS